MTVRSDSSCMNPGATVTLDPTQGAWAVSHARTVVESVVNEGSKPQTPASVDPVFEVERGAFVTLRKDEELRGCIGRPLPKQTALTAIRTAAAEAATNDPRFPPVTASELDDILVEVSILTPPQEVASVEPESITVGRDGLIVEREGRSGLLLPQVPVDQGWDAETFLDRTCQKAGLDAGCWKHSDITVKRFSAQVFAEREPNGTIEHVDDVHGGTIHE